MSLQELVGFLQSPQPEVARIALENILPATPATAGKGFLFKENDFQGARALKKLSVESTDSWAVQNALIALINISDDAEIRKEIASDSRAILNYAKVAATAPKTGLTKYACMLLSNLAREIETTNALKGAMLMALVLTVAKPDNMNDDSFDFLVLAFSEFARHDPKSIANLLPYLYPQLVTGTPNRKKAIAATIKNSLFDSNLHEPFTQDTPLIETIMICLKGPEPLDAEDFEQLPPAVRKEVSPKKICEPDYEVQVLLLECLVLLSSSQVGRDQLRVKNAYFVVREFHKVAQDQKLMDLCQNYVDMVMRGDPVEAPESKIQEIIEENNDDEGVTEIV